MGNTCGGIKVGTVDSPVSVGTDENAQTSSGQAASWKIRSPARMCVAEGTVLDLEPEQDTMECESTKEEGHRSADMHSARAKDDVDPADPKGPAGALFFSVAQVAPRPLEIPTIPASFDGLRVR